GLTDTLEVAVPLEAVWRPQTGSTALDAYGLDLRWRLASADAAKAGSVVPLLRLGARRVIPEDAARLEGDLVLSFELRRDLRAVVDVGASAVTASGGRAYGSFGAGMNYAVLDELRVGAELYGEVSFRSADDETWVSAGPSLSFTHGRFWLTAALPI